MAKPTALVVGGAGYFGSRLAEALGDDYDVSVTYRSNDAIRDAWLQTSGVSALHFDSDSSHTLGVAEPVDLLVNLATPGAREAARDPALAKERATKTIGLCGKMLQEGQAKRLIHFSTFHVYGGDPVAHYHEDMPCQPGHPYGQIHLELERIVGSWADTHAAFILRASNMVGAPAHLSLGDQAGLVFLDLCRQAAQLGQMRLGNDGGSYRDLLPFADAISAVRALANADDEADRVLNLAAGNAMSLRELAEAMKAASENAISISYGDGKDAFRSQFCIDTSRLRALGWAPGLDMRSEIEQAFEAFK